MTNMIILSQTNITMQNSARTMKRLCKHWAHKLTIEYDDDHGKVLFDTGIAHLTPFPEYLSIHLHADSQESLQHLQEVIDRHLIMMAHDESLEIQWLPTAKDN